MVCLYTNVGHSKSPESLQNLSNSLFFVCIAQLTLYMSATVMEFQLERSVFVKEVASNCYSVAPYFVAKVLTLWPLEFILPCVECNLYFWAVGYRAEAFYQFTLVFVLTAQVGTSLGYFISCYFKDVRSAGMAPPFVLMPSVLFGGFIANLSTMDKWLAWLQWISPTRFAFEALVWAQWPDDEYGIADSLGFHLGYTNCVLTLAVMAVLYRLATFITMTLLARSGFK